MLREFPIAMFAAVIFTFPALVLLCAFIVQKRGRAQLDQEQSRASTTTQATTTETKEDLTAIHDNEVNRTITPVHHGQRDTSNSQNEDSVSHSILKKMEEMQSAIGQVTSAMNEMSREKTASAAQVSGVAVLLKQTRADISKIAVAQTHAAVGLGAEEARDLFDKAIEYHAEQTSKLGDRITKLEKSISFGATKVAATKKKTTKKAQNDALPKNDIDEAGGKIKKLEAEVNDARATSASKEEIHHQIVTRMSQKIEDLELKIAKAEADKQSKVAADGEIIGRLQSERNQLSSKASALGAEKFRLEVKTSNMRHELNRTACIHRSDQKKLEGRTLELERAEAQNVYQNVRLRTQEKQIQDLRKKITKCRTSIRIRREENGQLVAEKKRLEVTLQRVQSQSKQQEAYLSKVKTQLMDRTKQYHDAQRKIRSDKIHHKNTLRERNESRELALRMRSRLDEAEKNFNKKHSQNMAGSQEQGPTFQDEPQVCETGRKDSNGAFKEGHRPHEPRDNPTTKASATKPSTPPAPEPVADDGSKDENRCDPKNSRGTIDEQSEPTEAKKVPAPQESGSSTASTPAQESSGEKREKASAHARKHPQKPCDAGKTTFRDGEVHEEGDPRKLSKPEHDSAGKSQTHSSKSARGSSEKVPCAGKKAAQDSEPRHKKDANAGADSTNNDAQNKDRHPADSARESSAKDMNAGRTPSHSPQPAYKTNTSSAGTTNPEPSRSEVDEADIKRLRGLIKSKAYREVLQIDRSVTLTDRSISKAYKIASLKYHPDKNFGHEEAANTKFRYCKVAKDELEKSLLNNEEMKAQREEQRQADREAEHKARYKQGKATGWGMKGSKWA